MKAIFRTDKGTFKANKQYEVLEVNHNSIVITGEDGYKYTIPYQDVHILEDDVDKANEEQWQRTMEARYMDREQDYKEKEETKNE